MMFILILFTYSWESLVPVLLASFDGVGPGVDAVDVDDDVVDVGIVV